MSSNGEIKNKTGQGDHGPISFTVPVEDPRPERPRSAPPKRLTNYTKKTLTKEELEQRLKQAESRRKEHEREMLARVQQRRDDVMRLNKTFSVLLEQDGKKQGCGVSSEIPTMSLQQLKEKFQSVNRDYNKMAKSMSDSTQLPK